MIMIPVIYFWIVTLMGERKPFSIMVGDLILSLPRYTPELIW